MKKLAAAALLCFTAASTSADELTVWMNSHMIKPSAEAWEAFVAQFEAQTGHTVDAQFFPHGEMQKRLFTALASGAGPDVLALDLVWVAGFADAGFLLELTDHVNPDDYLSGPFASGTYRGGQYALPLYTNNVALYVNNKLLQQAGHENPPTNWQELRQVSADMAALGEDIAGLSLGSSHWGVYQWYSFIWQNGGDIIDPQGTVRVAEEPAVEALAYLTGFHLEDKSLPKNVLTARSWDEVNAPFIQERAGLLITGDWGIGPITAGNPDLDFSIAPLPAGKQQAAVIGGYDIAVNAETDSPDAAIAFVKAITGADALQLMKATNRISASTAGQTPEALSEYDERMQVFIKQAAVGRARPSQIKWAQIDKILAGAWDQAIRGEGSPQDILQNAAAEIEPLLDQ